MPKITELPPAQNISKEDILLVIQNDTSKSAQAQLLKGSHEHDIEDIVELEETIEEKIDEKLEEELSKLVKKAGDTMTGTLTGPIANFNTLNVAEDFSAVTGVFTESLIVNGSGVFENIEVTESGLFRDLEVTDDAIFNNIEVRDTITGNFLEISNLVTFQNLSVQETGLFNVLDVSNSGTIQNLQVTGSGVFGELTVNSSGSFQNSLKVDNTEVSRVGHKHDLSSEIIADAGAQAYLFGILNISAMATELDEQNVAPGILYYSITSNKLKVNFN